MRKKSIILAIALVVVSSVLTMACAKENDEKSTYLHGDETETNEQAEVKAAEEEKPALEETPVEEFDYKYDSEYEGVRITEYKGEKMNIVIPEKIEDDWVVSVDIEKFDGKSITLPDTVAFVQLKYVSVRDISFPDNCEIIKLLSCDNLTEVCLPQNYKIAVIHQCDNLKNIEMPSGRIKQDVMVEGCPQITSIVYPEGTEEIWGGFVYCSNLESIEFPGSIKKLGPEFEKYKETEDDRRISGSDNIIMDLIWNAEREASTVDYLPFVACSIDVTSSFRKDGRIVFHMPTTSAPDSIMKVVKESFPLRLAEILELHSIEVEWDDEIWTLNEEIVKPAYLGLDTSGYLTWKEWFEANKEDFWIKNPK